MVGKKSEVPRQQVLQCGSLSVGTPEFVWWCQERGSMWCGASLLIHHARSTPAASGPPLFEAIISLAKLRVAWDGLIYAITILQVDITLS